MAYVDLNSERGGMKKDLEPVQGLGKRIDYQNWLKLNLSVNELPEAPLMPFDVGSHTSIHTEKIKGHP